MNALTARARALENALRRELYERLSEIYADRPRGSGAGAPTTRGYRLLARDIGQYVPGDDTVNADSLRVHLTVDDRAIPESVLYGATRRVDPSLLPRYDEIIALRDAARRPRVVADAAELDAAIAAVTALARADDWLGVRAQASAVLGAIAQLPDAQRDDPLMAWRWVKMTHFVAHSAMPTGDVLRGGRSAAIHRSIRAAELAVYYAERWPRADVPQPFQQLEWDGRSTAFQTACDAPRADLPRREHAWLMAEADRYASAATAIRSELVLREGQLLVQRGQLAAGLERLEAAFDLAEQSGSAYSFTVVAKDLAVALFRRGEAARARRSMEMAWDAARPITTGLLDVRLAVADLEMNFDRHLYDDVRERAHRGNYLHQMAKADRLAEHLWDRA